MSVFFGLFFFSRSLLSVGVRPNCPGLAWVQGGGAGRGKMYIFDRFISWVFSVCLGGIFYLFYFTSGCLGISSLALLSLPFCWVIVLYSSTLYHNHTFLHIHTGRLTMLLFLLTPHRADFHTLVFLFPGIALVLGRGRVGGGKLVGTVKKKHTGIVTLETF